VEPNYVWAADIELFGVWSAEVMQGKYVSDIHKGYCRLISMRPEFLAIT